MVHLDLNDSEQSTLSNALLLAAEKYEANAAEFRRMKPDLEADERDNPEAMRFIHSSACDGLAEQFDLQAANTRALMEKIDELED